VFLSEEWPGSIAPQTESVTNREKATAFKPMYLNFTLHQKYEADSETFNNRF
jgi:hypothetical protein